MNTTLIVVLVPLASWLLLSWPIKTYLGRPTKPDEKVGVLFGGWTLAYCFIEAAVPGRLGLAPNQLFLAWILGSLVVALLRLRSLRPHR
jgi:hypothetical protein